MKRLKKAGKTGTTGAALVFSALAVAGTWCASGLAAGLKPELPEFKQTHEPDEASKVIESLPGLPDSMPAASSQTAQSLKPVQRGDGQEADKSLSRTELAPAAGQEAGSRHRPWRARSMPFDRRDDTIPQVAKPLEDAETSKNDDKNDFDDFESKADINSQPADFVNALEIDPALHYNQAVAFTRQKKYKEAMDELHKALEQNPNYLKARYQLAFVTQMTGNSDKAIRLYKLYLNVKPDDAQAHINLGTLLKGTGNVPEAEEEYKKAIEVNFYSFAAHYDLANLLVEKDSLEQAQKEYTVCLKLKPDSAMVHNNLGVIYQKRNYLEEAEEEFARAQHLEPDNKVFHKNIALVRQQLKKGTGM